MGTIISDIKDDLQKLEELKRKIAEVRQELLSLDIRVEVDAKNDLEKKLKSLTEQYKEASKHVSQATALFEKDFKAISEAVDMTKPAEELRKFDEQLVKMCGNLDTYFEGLKGKLGSMLNLLGDGGTIAANIKTNTDNEKQLEELKRQNAELIEQVKQRQAELEKEQQIYRQLADAVRTNNVSAIQQLQQATSSVDTKKLLNDIKETNVEIGKQEQIVKELETAYEQAQARVARLQKSLTLKEDQWSGNAYGHLAELNALKDDLIKAQKQESRLKYQLGEAINAQGELNGQLAEYERQLESAGDKQERIRTQIMLAREQMARMIAAGLQGTPMFQQVAMEAGNLRKQMALANATMQYFADPNRNLTTLKTGLQGVAGAVGLVTGVMGLFNAESEKTAEIQTKVQSILGVIVGLETTYNMVKKTSNIMLAIEEVKTWALAKARGVQATATVAATAAQEGLNTAMRANPIGAIISLLAILGTAIYAVTKAIFSESDAEKKAREEMEARTKAIKEQHEQWTKGVADTASKQIVSYKRLQQKWNELGNDLKAKEQFVKDNKTAFHELGFSVDGVTDAESILVKNTDAVVNAIMARAKAAAYEKLMQDQYEKEVRARLEADKASKSVANGGSIAVVRVGDKSNQQSRAYDNAKKAGYTFQQGDVDSENRWTEQGRKRIEYFSRIYAAQQKKAFEDREKVRRETSQKEIQSTEKFIEKEMNAEKAAAEKAGLKLFDGGKDNSKDNAANARKAAEEARKRAEAQQKMAELLDRQKREQVRSAEDMQFQTSEAEIKAMSDGTDKTVKQIELEYNKELAAIRRSYEDLKLARIEEAKKLWEADPKNDGKNFFESGTYKNTNWDATYTADEDRNKAAREKAAAAARNRQLKELQKEQLQQMRDFVMEYGSIEEKRLAIAEEYAEKIKEAEQAGNAALAATLTMKAEEEDKRLQAEQMRMNINWDAIFQDVLDYDVQFLDTLQSQLEKAIKDGIERGIDAADLKVFADKLQDVRNALAGKKGGILSTNSVLGSSWLGSINQQRNKQNLLEKKAEQKRNESFSLQYKSAKADTDKADAQERYNEAVEKFGKTSTKAQNALEDFKVAVGKAEKAQQAAATAAGEASAAKSAAASNSGAMSLAITDAIIHGVNQNLQSASKMVQEWGIGDKDFQEKFSKFAESSQYATDAFDSLKNGDIAGVVYNLGNAFNTLGESFGVWTNSNRDEIQRENERLANAMAVNSEAVNRLTEQMKKQSPDEAYKTYETAVSVMKANEDAMKKTMLNNAAYYDGGHSLQYDFNDSEWRREVVKNIGKEIGEELDGTLQSLLNVDAEKLGKLYNTETGRQYLKDLGEAFSAAQDEGNYNGMFQDILNYINQFGSDVYDELKDAFLESSTYLNFDNMYDSFVSSLMDMDKSAQDFADDFEGYLRNAVYQSMAADLIKPKLDAWRKGLAKAMSSAEANGTYLSSAEIRQLMENGGTYEENGETKEFESYKEIEKAALELRETIEALGLGSGISDQSAAAIAAEKVTYEQADQIGGQLTAMQISGERRNELLGKIYDVLGTMAAGGVPSTTATNSSIAAMDVGLQDVTSDMRDLIAMSYLELVEIRDNTGAIVRPIRQMQVDIAEMRADIHDKL